MRGFPEMAPKPFKHGPKTTRRELTLPGGGRGRLEAATDGSVRVQLPKGTIPSDKLTAFQQALEDLLRRAKG